jgi:hypothetical protein
MAAETSWLSDPLSDAAEAEEERIRQEEEDKIESLRANPPRLADDRKIPGYQIGRCFLAVDDVTRIDGPCHFRIEENGGFHITGPRQVFRGVDFPENRAWNVSTDWWANVFKQDDGWTGYGNTVGVEQINGQRSRWGVLEQEGACFFNERTRRDYKTGDYHEDYQDKVRVCLWRE